jgi:hypothetical protein
MDDKYAALYKRAWHIQHKVAHLAINLTLLANSKAIPAPERNRLKRITDHMWELALMKLESPDGELGSAGDQLACTE